jgi:hypothetical protein
VGKTRSVRDNKTVLDHFRDHEEVRELFARAERNASTTWEMAFVDDQKARFTTYGINTYMSDSQAEKLLKIADKEHR